MCREWACATNFLHYVQSSSLAASPTLVSFYFSQVGCASLTFLRYRFKYWVQLYSDRVSGRPLQIIQIQLSTVALYIMTGKIGLSEPSVATSEIVVICSQPSVTLPNTVWTPLR
jgi:hypothetical protein